jgi:hypothetical protein
MSFTCEYCENSFTTKNHLIRHYKSDSCQKIQKLILKHEKQKNETIENIKTEYGLKISSLQENINDLQQQLKEREINIKNLEKSNDEYRKIVEKAATKTTVKNYTHNNYLNYISAEPIKFNDLPKQLKEFINCETVMYNESDFHDHIVDNILKDENGKDKLLCTDINRKNFSYKDEMSGELISDPELEKLREQLKRGADIKSVKKEVLSKLIDKYEGTSKDPYMKLYEMVKKLEFGSPFVEHVAKKTYIKTKSTDVNN